MGPYWNLAKFGPLKESRETLQKNVQFAVNLDHFVGKERVLRRKNDRQGNSRAL